MERKVRFSNYNTISNNKECVIEFQAFRDNKDRYIVKELVILDTDTGISNYFLFKPPFNLNSCNAKSLRTNKWLTKYFHHITWDEGFTDYKEFDNIMYYYCQQFGKIYTSGSEKVKQIHMYTTSTVIDYKVPKNNDHFNFSGICFGVKSDKHKVNNCALLKAYRIAALISSSKTGSDGGGEGDYIYGSVPQTYHEYYSSLRGGNTADAYQPNYHGMPATSSISCGYLQPTVQIQPLTY